MTLGTSGAWNLAHGPKFFGRSKKLETLIWISFRFWILLPLLKDFISRDAALAYRKHTADVNELQPFFRHSWAFVCDIETPGKVHIKEFKKFSISFVLSSTIK